MLKLINNLPKLTQDQIKTKEDMCNRSTRDNFTVTRCPLMENFENIESSLYSSKLSKSEIAETNNKPVNLMLHPGLFASNSLTAITSDNNTDIDEIISQMLPKIHGITKDIDDDDDDDSLLPRVFTPDTMTKLYVSSLSIVGLFILFRVVKKTM
jgi:hypothetical protein